MAFQDSEKAAVTRWNTRAEEKQAGGLQSA